MSDNNDSSPAVTTGAVPNGEATAGLAPRPNRDTRRDLDLDTGDFDLLGVATWAEVVVEVDAEEVEDDADAVIVSSTSDTDDVSISNTDTEGVADADTEADTEGVSDIE